MKSYPAKIKTLSNIIAITRHARRAGKTIVTTNGAFDLLHIGHVRSLEKAKSAGDILIVGVNSDASVRTHKDKTRPIIPEKERAEMIAALESVDYVFIFTSPDPLPWIKKIRPDIHVKGADRSIAQLPEAAIIKKYGGKLLLTPIYRSTTAIIKKIKQIP